MNIKSYLVVTKYLIYPKINRYNIVNHIFYLLNRCNVKVIALNKKKAIT